MATIKDIAERAQVSIGTVDRVLHNRGRVQESTRSRVLEIAEMLGYTPNRAAQVLVAQRKNIHIGFFELDEIKNPFFSAVNHAARKKAAELRKKGIMVDFFKLDTEIAGGAIKCRNLESLRRGAIDLLDGAAFPGCDAASINYLLRPGTPYVLYNSQVPDAHPLAFVGSDFYKSGQIAGGLCAKCTDEFGEIVAIAEGVPSYAPIAQRIAGFSDSINKYYSRCKITEKIYYTCYDEEAQHNIFSFFRKHPHVSSVYIVSAADYSVCKTIRDADPAGSVRIITNDMTDIQKRLICSGIISATITQEPEMQGSLPLEILYQYLVYGKEAEKTVFYTNLDIQLPVCIG